MKLNFLKINPVENMTIFVLDEVDRKRHIEIAKKLMNYNNLHAEQVGFVEKIDKAEDESCKYKLQMMGGEFCGNATRSLAALLVHKNDDSIKKVDDKFYVNVQTSGIDKIMSCVVKVIDEHTYTSKINMPLPNNKPQKMIVEGGYTAYKVNFDGIVHFVVDVKEFRNKEIFFDIVKELMHDEEYEAFGIMYYNYETCYMEPLVYVKATDSLYWERSCASGTSALGAVLSHKLEESVFLDVHQPGGVLSISTEFDGKNLRAIVLDGMVEIVAEGIVNV